MKKHRFNIFPEMGASEYSELLADIKAHGFDHCQPVIIFQGEILDGWHRYMAATDAGVEHSTREFGGSDIEALEYVLRVNIRRNLTSQQRAALAVEADEIIQLLKAAVEQERRSAQAASQAEKKGAMRQKIASQPPTEPSETPKMPEKHYEIDEYVQISSADESLRQKIASNSEATQTGELTYELDEPTNKRDQKKVSHRLAKRFNTNRTYVSEAMKLKETAPDKLEEVKAGTTTFQQIKKDEAQATPAIDPNDSTRDEFTAIAEQLSKKVHKLLTEAKDVITAARVQFADKDQMLEVWAPRLDKAEFIFEIADCQKLRGLRVCPVCSGKQCDECNETGYVKGKDFTALSKGV